MGNFKDRGGRGGGFRGGDRGGRSGGFGGNRGGERRPISMHKAICDNCHKSCEVPFKPSTDKPIYCNDCFGDKRGNENPRRDFEKRDSRRDFGGNQNFSRNTNENSSSDTKKQLMDINSKLDFLLASFEKMNVSKKEEKIVVKKVEEKPVLKNKVEKKATPVKKAPAVKVVATNKKAAEKKTEKKVEKKVVAKKKK